MAKSPESWEVQLWRAPALVGPGRDGASSRGVYRLETKGLQLADLNPLGFTAFHIVEHQPTTTVHFDSGRPLDLKLVFAS